MVKALKLLLRDCDMPADLLRIDRCEQLPAAPARKGQPQIAAGVLADTEGTFVAGYPCASEQSL